MIWLLMALTPRSDELFASQERPVQVVKQSDLDTVVTRTFATPRQAVFDALTSATHIVHWMKPANMTLVACDVDFRLGGLFRYVFQRPSGRRLEVRGTYTNVDPPHRWVYTETYDFSPLQLLVTMNLDEKRGETHFTQTIVYSSRQERDEDFEGVATSAITVYANLERYLASLP